jgi:hypothetical protein
MRSDALTIMMAKNENVVAEANAQRPTSKSEWRTHTSETVGEAVSFPIKK